MKLFLVYLITTNHMEPLHYSSHITESLQGIYDTMDKATVKIDELHEGYRKTEEEYPEYDYIECSITIKEQLLNQ